MRGSDPEAAEGVDLDLAVEVVSLLVQAATVGTTAVSPGFLSAFCTGETVLSPSLCGGNKAREFVDLVFAGAAAAVEAVLEGAAGAAGGT